MSALDNLNPRTWSIWRYLRLLVLMTVAFFVANVRTEDGMTALMTSLAVLAVAYFGVS